MRVGWSSGLSREEDEAAALLSCRRRDRSRRWIYTKKRRGEGEVRDKGQGGEGSGVTSIILRMMGLWNLSAPSCSQQSSSASFPSSWRRSRSRRPEPSSRETISARPRKQTKWKAVQPVCPHTEEEDEDERIRREEGDNRRRGTHGTLLVDIHSLAGQEQLQGLQSSVGAGDLQRRLSVLSTEKSTKNRQANCNQRTLFSKFTSMSE